MIYLYVQSQLAADQLHHALIHATALDSNGVAVPALTLYEVILQPAIKPKGKRK